VAQKLTIEQVLASPREIDSKTGGAVIDNNLKGTGKDNPVFGPRFLIFSGSRFYLLEKIKETRRPGAPKRRHPQGGVNSSYPFESRKSCFERIG
jgi:hypothetical protein